MSFLNGTDPGLRQTRTPTTDNFAAGVDFTAGSTTQLTLSADPGTEDNVEITFDGIQQHRNTYSVSGAVVTFDAAIGAGVSNVEATFTTTIPAAEPADNSVTSAKLADDLINSHTDTVITAADEILFADATDSNAQKKDTVQGILDLVPAAVTLGTEQATTSGTTIDFTSIPSGTKRIDIMFDGVSTGGTSDFLIQIGDSGGIETTGYVSTGWYLASTSTTSTTGFIINSGGSAAFTLRGRMTLLLVDSANFTWISDHVTIDSGPNGMIGAGSKSLSAELDRIRLTTVSGDTFDSGSMNIQYS